MTVSDFIWQYLADLGVSHVFHLVGGGSMHLVDSLGRQSRITPVAMQHEQAAGWAAIAYAQATGKLGVCLVTTGPGGTNAVTPCAAAWIDSTPVLFISGQVPTDLLMRDGERQRGPQEVGIADIVKAITKDSTVYENRYLTPSWVMRWMTTEAMENPSGPVWLDIPLDVQGAQI